MGIPLTGRSACSLPLERGHSICILPSLLAADYGRLAEGCRLAQRSGGDALHVDIMDGVFVPNISLGPDVVRMIRRETPDFHRHVHLMLIRPDRYIERFVDAGADTLLIHIEADCDVVRTLVEIRRLGIRVGITLNPETAVETLYPVLGQVDEVLVMSVRPGYGGQRFMPEVLPKIRALRQREREQGLRFDIAVDGGIDRETAQLVARAGANLLIAGTSLFGASDMRAAIAEMRALAEKARATQNKEE
jgi:ribulose-phosphate 3-epimerase